MLPFPYKGLYNVSLKVIFIPVKNNYFTGANFNFLRNRGDSCLIGFDYFLRFCPQLEQKNFIFYFKLLNQLRVFWLHQTHIKGTVIGHE